jgi:hypothetical protein
MGRALAALAGVAAWIGWFSLSPALGSPSLVPAAMLNRVLAPRADAGYWLGWAVLIAGLAVTVLIYLTAVQRGLWRPTVLSGVLYGAFCWLVAGLLVMPILGLLDPFPVAAPPAPADPMHGTFMMLHLGPGAAISSLVSWLLLGTVLGATADWRPNYSARSWAALYAAAAAIVVLAVVAWAIPASLPATSAAAASRTLASGPVAGLPEGQVFISVFRLPQAAGASLGPHAHVPGFACSIRGVETIAFADAPSARVSPGGAGFMGAQQVHTHLNGEDRLPAGAVAVGIVALVALVAGVRQLASRDRILPLVLIGLIALSGVAVWNPWSNDWLFISIRPASARGGPMPLPTASRVFESADLVGLPAGPYTESMSDVTVASGTALSIEETGAGVIVVLDGQARLEPSGGATTLLGVQQATLLQPGSLTVLNAEGGHTVRLLRFEIVPASSG